jgi:hypothetical protein
MLTTFCLLTVVNSSHSSIRCVQVGWRSKIPQSLLHLLRIWMYYWDWTQAAGWRPGFVADGVISVSPSSTSLACVVMFQLHLRVVYIYRNLFDMRELARHAVSF